MVFLAHSVTVVQKILFCIWSQVLDHEAVTTDCCRTVSLVVWVKLVASMLVLNGQHFHIRFTKVIMGSVANAMTLRELGLKVCGHAWVFCFGIVVMLQCCVESSGLLAQDIWDMMRSPWVACGPPCAAGPGLFAAPAACPAGGTVTRNGVSAWLAKSRKSKPGQRLMQRDEIAISMSTSTDGLQAFEALSMQGIPCLKWLLFMIHLRSAWSSVFSRTMAILGVWPQCRFVWQWTHVQFCKP